MGLLSWMRGKRGNEVKTFGGEEVSLWKNGDNAWLASGTKIILLYRGFYDRQSWYAVEASRPLVKFLVDECRLHKQNPREDKPMSSSDVLASLPTKHPHAENRVYGWKRSERASYHPAYKLPQHHVGGANLPASVDLSPYCPAVYDQGQLGSCTANALAGLFQFLQLKQGLPSFVPSRLMLYFGERDLEGTKYSDAGANGDDGVTFLMTKGICPETMWPYDINRFTECPPPVAWGVAWHHRLYDPVTIADGDLIGLKSRLAMGYPVAFGFTAYPELESQQVGQTGHLTMPTYGEQPIGGHEVLIVGYDEMSQQFKMRNSWGAGWGLGGYFWMPYAYVGNTSLASDFRSAGRVS